MSSVITFRADDEVVQRLDKLAERTGRSRSALVAEAVKEYAEEQAAFLDFIAEGEDDIAAGRYYTLEEMDRWFDEGIRRAEMAIAAREKAA